MLAAIVQPTVAAMLIVAVAEATARSDMQDAEIMLLITHSVALHCDSCLRTPCLTRVCAHHACLHAKHVELSEYYRTG
jgi:hypothetical protein